MFTKKGFTLLEVLISAMVIMVGILGVATLIPASKYQINEAVKADMAATIGRSALKMIITQNWMSQFEEPELTGGGTDQHSLPSHDKSIGKAYCFNWDSHEEGGETGHTHEEDTDIADFHCSCDLVPDPSKYTEGEEAPVYNTSLHGKFEWSATIRKIETSYYEISAAVSYQRGSSLQSGNSGEDISEGPKDIATFSLSNGSIEGNNLKIKHTGDYEFRPGEWIYVSNSSTGHWYKILQIAFEEDEAFFMLQGPYWNSGSGLTVDTPGNVIAVYTEVVPYPSR